MRLAEPSRNRESPASRTFCLTWFRSCPYQHHHLNASTKASLKQLEPSDDKPYPHAAQPQTARTRRLPMPTILADRHPSAPHVLSRDPDAIAKPEGRWSRADLHPQGRHQPTRSSEEPVKKSIFPQVCDLKAKSAWEIRGIELQWC